MRQTRSGPRWRRHRPSQVSAPAALIVTASRGVGLASARSLLASHGRRGFADQLGARPTFKDNPPAAAAHAFVWAAR